MKRITFLALALALVPAVGCSPPRAVVRGKVTVGGQPLTGGSIRLESIKDPNLTSGGTIKSDGTYEIPDAPVGECKVIIDNTHLAPKAQGMGGKGGGMGMKGMKGAPPVAGPKIGQKPKDAAKAGGGGAPAGLDVGAMGDSGGPGKYMPIDAAHTKSETTQLKATVKKGTNDGVNFDIN